MYGKGGGSQPKLRMKKFESIGPKLLEKDADKNTFLVGNEIGKYVVGNEFRNNAVGKEIGKFSDQQMASGPKKKGSKETKMPVLLDWLARDKMNTNQETLNNFNGPT